MKGPLTRDEFATRFGRRAVFGMIHLLALPGSPRYEGSMARVIDAALRDARAIVEGGASGLVIENFGDRPFRKTKVDPETIAAMSVVISAVRREVSLPFGVNVLRNDPQAALGIAGATGAAFIRVNVHTGAMLTDQGIIEGEADRTMRTREVIAPDVAVFADHLVKHAMPIAPVDDIGGAHDLRARGLADAIIVTGRETGAAPDAARFDRLRKALDAPLILGSGFSPANAAQFVAADAVIVGTGIKIDGKIELPVDRHRVEAVVAAFRG
jgi:membrane complex biogenesis BtpA family protein